MKNKSVANKFREYGGGKQARRKIFKKERMGSMLRQDAKKAAHSQEMC